MTTMFGNDGFDPFGHQDQGQDNGPRDLAGRISSMQFNLDVQQHVRPVQAAGILARIFGQALADRSSR